MGKHDKIKLVHILTVPESLRFFEGQIEYIQLNGYEIQVITSPNPLLDEFAKEYNIQTYGIEMPRRITPFRDLIAIWNIWRVLRKIKPDIVHSHTPKGGLLGTIVASIARVPVRIYHARGLPFEGATGNRRTLLKLTEYISCWLAHRVFCNSQSNLDVMVNEGLCAKNKITVLHNGSSNGVDATKLFKPFETEDTRTNIRESLNLPLDSTVIGFVGRIVHDKGIDELIEAWQILREQYSEIRLLFVGRFEEQDAVFPSTKQVINSDERIHFAEFVNSKQDMPTLYAAMDILVLPSHREGLPNVILEAGGMGIPVVSTLASGCKDAVVDGETGVLVPVSDAKALVRSIQGYLDDPTLGVKHGQAARAHILHKYKPDDIWKAMLTEYQNLLRLSESKILEKSQSGFEVRNS